MAAINKYNFLRWAKPGEVITRDLPSPYRIDNGWYSPVMVPGETTSFYINCNFTQDFEFSVSILKEGVVVKDNVLVLSRVVTDSGFELYGALVCPVLESGYYNLAIYSQGFQLLVSNPLFVMITGYEKTTTLVRFRHDDVLYGFNYDLIPEFYQQFRIHLSEVDHQYDYSKEQYRSEISRALRNFYSTTDRYVKFETYYFDDGAHEAVAAMIDHDEIYIGGQRFMFKEGYKPEYDQRSSISKGQFELWEWQYSVDQSQDITDEVLFSNLGYYNQERSGSFTRNTCPSLYSSEPVTYLVEKGKYFSLESQEAANQMADDEIALNGQNYANENGVCILESYSDSDGEAFTDSDGEEFI